MIDIMKEERLLRRFDAVHAKYMVALWQRVVTRASRFLEEIEQVLFWNCQAITVPFRKLEEAPLFALVSEGSDPLDGGDFLFLMINEITAKFNGYVQQLSEVRQAATQSDAWDDPSPIHPKFLMAGSGGSVVINQSSVLSRFDLEILVQGCWNSEVGEFDCCRLAQWIRQAAVQQSVPPTIRNPLQSLRREFLFRVDPVSEGDRHERFDDVAQATDGSFFAREQDLLLVGAVNERLNAAFGSVDNDKSIRPNLCAEFHKELDSYQKTADVLGGLRNFLGLQSSAKTMKDGLSGLDSKSCHSETSEHGIMMQLQQIGFPEISLGNLDLLLALDERQFVEFVRYASFHLASEGYLYASMPVAMARPLSASTVQRLSASLKELCQEKGSNVALEFLREFVEDVLIIYQTLIIEAAGSHNKSLKHYLEENNFCGQEDPIFRLLPDEIALQNYVSLRQHLQQASLAFHHGITGCPERETEESGAFVNFSPGQCWLWHPEAQTSVQPVPIRLSSGALWFLDCPTINEECARRIQKWWRGVASRPGGRSTMDAEQDDTEFFDARSGAADEMEEHDDTTYFDFDNYDEIEIDTMPIEMPDDMQADAYSRMDESSCDLQMWLKEHTIPQHVFQTLIELGASTIDDVRMVVAEEDLLATFKKLDQVKLKNAVEKLL